MFYVKDSSNRISSEEKSFDLCSNYFDKVLEAEDKLEGVKRDKLIKISLHSIICTLKKFD